MYSDQFDSFILIIDVNNEIINFDLLTLGSVCHVNRVWWYKNMIVNWDPFDMTNLR